MIAHLEFRRLKSRLHAMLFICIMLQCSESNSMRPFLPGPCRIPLRATTDEVPLSCVLLGNPDGSLG